MSLRTMIWGGPADWMRVALAAGAAGVVVGLIGPFGTYAIPPAIRIFYCAAMGVISAIVFWPTMWFAWRAARRASWSPWATGLLAAAAMSLPLWLLFRALGSILWLGQAPGPESAAKGFFDTLLFLTPTALVATYLHVLRTAASTVSRGPVTDEIPPLLRRLPPALGRDVLALEAEDHYVRVHTSAGSTLVLSRFADAIAGLSGVEGLRVHRSWWVARHAVRSATIERRRLSLILVNGLTAPVSRQAAPLVRREGWARPAPAARPGDLAT
ncbi:MAG TPA: LytTR family DNA-binding domain-containing protein [Phenylobacterium sp.]